MEQVQEESADAAVNVQHQVGCLGERVSLHPDGKVQVLGGGEVAPGIHLQQLHALVPVVLQHPPTYHPSGHTCLFEVIYLPRAAINSISSAGNELTAE